MPSPPPGPSTSMVRLVTQWRIWVSPGRAVADTSEKKRSSAGRP